MIEKFKDYPTLRSFIVIGTEKIPVFLREQKPSLDFKDNDEAVTVSYHKKDRHLIQDYKKLITPFIKRDGFKLIIYRS